MIMVSAPVRADSSCSHVLFLINATTLRKRMNVPEHRTFNCPKRQSGSIMAGCQVASERDNVSRINTPSHRRPLL